MLTGKYNQTFLQGVFLSLYHCVFYFLLLRAFPLYVLLLTTEKVNKVLSSFSWGSGVLIVFTGKNK